MALLAKPTTVKPNVGSPPTELVYDIGLAVPGELLPDIALEKDLMQQRKCMLGNLHVKVECLQPTPTSAHRQPCTYLANDLERATQVFIRCRGPHSSIDNALCGPLQS